MPKLEESKAARVAHLSFRDAVAYIARGTNELGKLEPEQQAEVLDEIDSGKRIATVPQLIARASRSCRRKASMRQMADEFDQAQGEALSTMCESSWVATSGHTLQEEIGQEDEFRQPSEEVAALESGSDAMYAQIEKLNVKLRDMEGELLGKRNDIARRISEEIRQRHGHEVFTCTVTIRREGTGNSSSPTMPVDSEEFDRIAELGGEEQHEAIMMACCRCPDCGVFLNDDTVANCPDDPGMYYATCKWCREHRGKTHCFGCGKPLSPDAIERGCDFCNECDPPPDEALIQELNEWVAAGNDPADWLFTTRDPSKRRSPSHEARDAEADLRLE